MDAIDNLRSEIKNYFAKSRELQLSGSFSQHRRFNFYFEIELDTPYLLYLNWDEGDRFTLKCLEFAGSELLSNLIKTYPELGSKTFNVGQPRSMVSFIYRSANHLTVTELKGAINLQLDSRDISGAQLMQCVDPGF